MLIVLFTSFLSFVSLLILFFSFLTLPLPLFSFFFFLNDPAPPEIYPLPQHAALPISERRNTPRNSPKNEEVPKDKPGCYCSPPIYRGCLNLDKLSNDQQVNLVADPAKLAKVLKYH